MHVVDALRRRTDVPNLMPLLRTESSAGQGRRQRGRPGGVFPELGGVGERRMGSITSASMRTACRPAE